MDLGGYLCVIFAINVLVANKLKASTSIRHKMLKTFGIHVVLYCPFLLFLVLFQLWRWYCCCCCYCWQIDENSAAFVCTAYKWNLFIFCDLTERRARMKQQLRQTKIEYHSLAHSLEQCASAEEAKKEVE